MKTTLSPEKLAQLHAEGNAKVGPFVNPYTIAKCKELLRDRGRDWAASVLLRDLSRNSAINPRFPWLNSGEEEILVLADLAEWDQLAAGMP
ncbi:hypothetical protein [Mycobacterium intracellulare]|uniref:Uncharacterized protein n=1 Tax=Mycobacterium intracellulare TaxID=1767 RepID=A0AAE4REI4_MYCIT|nr:hypothetical protein [Mycobacterium intracellulare]MDV6979637.1 hypothetical protein [Mycobacterium intracellulare]MDV6985140.1 hypothetical protein [Mycobacterium intracellulare]MDV7014240.1 hypothetical protein [Mycobacterium intracellulare]MDV7030131.1 hypothetical protein [Mycobacterium intracellulare]